MSVKEIKRLKVNAQNNKSKALKKGDHLHYVLNCKIEKLLNRILGEDVDARFSKKKK